MRGCSEYRQDALEVVQALRLELRGVEKEIKAGREVFPKTEEFLKASAPQKLKTLESSLILFDVAKRRSATEC